MSWDEIVAEADGKTVNLGQYPDAFLLDWYNNYFIPYMKTNYNITVNIKGTMYGDNGANQIVTDTKAGDADKTVDAVWGAVSAYGILLDNSTGKNLNFMDNWVSYLPNSKYLPESDNLVAGATYEYITGESWKDKGIGSAMPFSSGVSAMVYNPDYNVVKVGNTAIPYNVVVIEETAGVYKYVKVQADAYTYDASAKKYTYSPTGFYGDASQLKSSVADAVAGTAYNISEVRWYYFADHAASSVIYTGPTTSETVSVNPSFVSLKYGLPTNFIEMLSWAQIYDQQVTYANPTSTGAWFHGYMFVQSVMYELCWKDQDPSTGMYDLASNYTWKNGAGETVTYAEYLNEKLKDVPAAMTQSSNLKYNDLLGYAYVYLKALDPYCNAAIGHNYQWINSQTGHLIGTSFSAGMPLYPKVKLANVSVAPEGAAAKATAEYTVTDGKYTYNSNTVMCSWSSVGSVAMREGSYTTNFGVTMLNTSVCDTYYWAINDGSENKAAVLVVLNELLSPKAQSYWYYANGNNYNIDVGLFVDDKDNVVDSSTPGAKTIWDKYFQPVLDNGISETIGSSTWVMKVKIGEPRVDKPAETYHYDWTDATKYIDQNTLKANAHTDYMVAWNMYLTYNWSKNIN